MKNPITSSLGTSVSLLTCISYAAKAVFNFSCKATSNLPFNSLPKTPD